MLRHAATDGAATVAEALASTGNEITIERCSCVKELQVHAFNSVCKEHAVVLPSIDRRSCVREAGGWRLPYGATE